MIDLRSDTLTKPSPEMMSAMIQLPLLLGVGDDVYSEDEAVNKLQLLLAEMFGMEAGLYCPSGTMTNQIAIKVHTQPGDELICSDIAHIYKYEAAGIAFNSGVQARTIKGDNGRITAKQIEEEINGSDVHSPITRLVCLENTSNRGGGSIYPFDEIKNIRELCDEKKLALHLDGARIFNAITESNYTAKDMGNIFDSISVCLSKGLGTPVGSVLLGTKEFINKAKRVRKVFGGGMRQAGFIAAAGIYALQNNIERLKDDHIRAKKVASVLKQKSFIKELLPVETNIIIFTIISVEKANHFQEYLKEHTILCGKVSATQMRFVFHLDITDAMVNDLIDQIEKYQ